jgi:nitrate reductase NapD
MAGELHVASLLVHVRPDRLGPVREAVAATPGAEIHAEEAGKLVVVLEGPHEGWVADRMTEMHLMEGVLSAVLVFHHVELLGGGPLGEEAVAPRQGRGAPC